MKVFEIITEAPRPPRFWTYIPFDKSPSKRDEVHLNLGAVLKQLQKKIGGEITNSQSSDEPVMVNIPGDQSQVFIRVLAGGGFSIAKSTRASFPKIVGENRVQVKMSAGETDDAFLYIPSLGELYHSS